MRRRGLDNDETWKSIINNEGSVQHLTSLEAPEKEVYLTAREINLLHYQPCQLKGKIWSAL